MEEPYIADSARRHGLADDDILHAHTHAFHEDRDDEGLHMRVGPDRSGALIEVGFVMSDDDVDVIVHAMPMQVRRMPG